MNIKSRNWRIQAENVELRPFSDTDENDALEIFLSEEVQKTYMLPEFESRDAASKLFKRLLKMSHDEQRFIYGVFFGEKLIGIINEVDKDDELIELGYAINPGYKNHGYATMALRACIKELKRMGYKTIRAGYFEENTASSHVMEKCGMRMIEHTDTVEYRGKTHKCRYFEI